MAATKKRKEKAAANLAKKSRTNSSQAITVTTIADIISEEPDTEYEGEASELENEAG